MSIFECGDFFLLVNKRNFIGRDLENEVYNKVIGLKVLVTIY